MAITHYRSRRKPSGGRYRAYRTKKLYEMGRAPELPRVGERKVKLTRGRGGNIKVKLQHADFINVTDPKTKQTFKVKMSIVSDNPANRLYTRRNILTKGAIVETEKGKIKVTNRPGQEGCVNGILLG